MIAQEKYNKIIETIEELIASRSPQEWSEPLNPKEVGHIAFKAADCEYIDDRSKNEIFKFLTGMTLPQYINYRTIMYTYSVLLDQHEFSLDALINITGVSYEAGLYKKFKDQFGITPKEAFLRKDTSLYIKPAKWENISEENKEYFTKTIEVIKVVPVEVLKPDKQPFIIAIVAVLLVIASIALGKSVIEYHNLCDIWSDTYHILSITFGADNTYVDTENYYDETLVIDASTKTGSLILDELYFEFKITKILPEKIVFHITNNPDANGDIEIQNCGEGIIKLEIQYDDGSPYMTRIYASNETLDKLVSQWSGDYDMKCSKDNFLYPVKDSYAFINVNSGIISFYLYGFTFCGFIDHIDFDTMTMHIYDAYQGDFIFTYNSEKEIYADISNSNLSFLSDDGTLLFCKVG